MKTPIVERPILFSGPMVKAILDGRKTQTRRIVKPQPPDSIDELHGNELRKRAPYAIQNNDGNDCGWGFQDEDNNYNCPYGKIGERLWVREKCWSDGRYVYYPADCGHKSFTVSDESNERLEKLYRYGSQFRQIVPSIHMPRWACRIVLEIEKIRVERLHEITNADCVAEGIEPLGDERITARISSGFEALPEPIRVQAGKFDSKYSTVRGLFSGIWQQIHGVESWVANPWVWVIEFRKLED